jgi:hypothetical protein
MSCFRYHLSAKVDENNFKCTNFASTCSALPKSLNIESFATPTQALKVVMQDVRASQPFVPFLHQNLFFFSVSKPPQTISNGFLTRNHINCYIAKKQRRITKMLCCGGVEEDSFGPPANQAAPPPNLNNHGKKFII